MSLGSGVLVAGFPHVRGGVSQSILQEVNCDEFSPRTWGCFHGLATSIAVSGVFPTYVGVFLAQSLHSSRTCCFPHVRGGVSLYS